MKKRILALALTLAMLLSMLPYQVFAAGPVIDGGVHTEHNFEPVTSNPVTQQPDQTQQTPQVEDPSAPVQSQGVPQRGETTGILSLLDYEAAIKDLTVLSKDIGIRVAGSENEFKAQDYVAAKFEEMGYEVKRQEFPTRNGTSQNVFGVKKAGVETDLTIYISAHIDTVSPSPGANDDGSGIVAMLAIARAMKDIETKSNIVFVSCGAEEIGLYGSKYFASQLTSEEKANAIGNYNMDMIATSYEDCKYMVIMSASKETVNGIEIYDNHTTRLAQEAARSLGYGEEHFKLLYGTPSDHSSFHNVGIPAVQFYWATDNTSFRLVNGRYPVEPEMHTAGDNMEDNFSQERFQLMVDAIALAVYNDATADYVAVVGEGATREYYTDMAEARAAAGTKKVTDLKADKPHEHNDIIFESLPSDYLQYGYISLENENIYVEDDIQVELYSMRLKSTTNLCLNGHTMTIIEPGLQMYSDGATLNIYDCSDDDAKPGRIYFAGGDAIFTTNGQYTLSLSLYGGEIVSGNGYGIRHEAGSLTLYGGTVTGTAADIYLGGGLKINIGQGFEPDDGETYRIQLDNAGLAALQAGGAVQITEGYGASGYTGDIPFESVHAEYDIFTKTVDGKTEVYIGTVPHEHDGVEFTTVITQDMLSMTEWNRESSYVTPTSGYYYLTSDLTLPKELRFQGGGTFYICLNGNNILGEKRVTVFGGSKVYICDCKGDGYIHSAYRNGCVISYGEFHLLGGTFSIKDTTGTQMYGHNGASHFYLEGGTLLGYANGDATPIYIYGVDHDNCSFVLRSGELKNLGSGYCVAHLGAGALVLDGSFKLSGSGDIADIFLQNLIKKSTPLLTITENFDPKGEVYTVESGDAIPDSGYRITDGWSKVRSKIGYIPFESNQGYAVKEITVNGVTELYLIKAHDHAMFEGSNNVVEFEPLSIPAEGITLTTGNYVLTGSAELNGGQIINVTGDVNLCLAGNTLKLSSGEIHIKDGASLSLCDCIGSGKITSTARTIVVDAGGEFYLYNGTIENTYGTGTYAISNSGKTTLYGGTVSSLNGNGIQVATGTVIIDSENLTISGAGTGVVVSGEFCVSGSPVITGKIGVSVSATFKLAGSPVINGASADIRLSSGKVITLDGTLLPPDGETYSIMPMNPLKADKPKITITSRWSAEGYGPEEIKYFTPVNQTYTIEQEGNELILKAHVHDLPDGSKILYDTALTQAFLKGCDMTGDDKYYVLPTGNYLLTESFAMSQGLRISGGEVHLCLCGNSMDIWKGERFLTSLHIWEGASLRIDDCQSSCGSITGGWYGSDSRNGPGTAHSLDSKGTLILANGILSMGSDSPGCGNFKIAVGMYGELIIEGGEINNALYGIWLLTDDTTGTLSSGTIKTDNYAVYLQCGKVFLKGSPDLQGGVADIYFENGSQYIHFEEGGTLELPEVAYTIDHVSAPNATTDIQITSGWENSGLASTATTAAKIPFVSTQGYAVREITKDGVKELYLVIPKVEVNYDENMGEAAVTPNGGKEGTGITVTATPLEGYAVDSITMSYWDGTQTVTTTLDTSNVGEDSVVTSTFTMPAADVTVDVTFKELHRHFMAITEDCEDGGVQPNGVNADKVIFSRDLAAALEKSNTLTTGSYVLNDDFTYSSDIHISGNVDICLQGKILTLDSTSQIRMIVGAGATLRICDCVGTGEVHGKSYQCVQIDDPTGALHLYGGNLHTAGADCVTTEGTVHIMGGAIDSGRNRGINCYQGNSIVHVYGGSVSGYSEGILTYYTEVKVVAGRIESRTARGIWVGSDTTVEISGGTIIGKTYGLEMRTDATIKNTQIILKGDPVIDGDTADISLIKDYKITVGGKLTGTDTYSVAVQTGPTPEAPVQITTEWEKAELDYIPFSSSQGYFVIEDETTDGKTEVYLIVPEVVTDSDENGTLAMTSPTSADAVRVGNTITLKATPNNADYTYGTVTVTYTDDNGDEVTVPVTNKGNGTYTFTMPDAKVVYAYATFKPVHKHYMAVDWEFGHEDKGYTHADGTAVGDKAVFATALNQSYFGQNQSKTLGKGYYYLEEDVTLNKITVSGGGGGFTNSNAAYICLAGHTLTLTGGMDNLYDTQIIICDCSADKSGKIDVQNSQLVLENGGLTLYGGTITGGGTYTVNVKNGRQVKIFGGKVISNNNTVIYTNHSNASLGQVHIYGGEVCANGTNGKAINSEKATSVWIEGGKITSDGTAVTMTSSGTLTVKGGEIRSANDYAISHGGGAFKLSGAPVLEGTSADIYLASGKVITVDGAITGSDYKVLTDQKPINAPDKRVQITTGWATYGEGVTDYPFTSKENYVVYKLSDDNELYLIIPKVVTDTDGNGTLAMTDPTEANVRVGSTITLEAKPNEGYKYGTVTVTYKDAEGKEITETLTPGADGKVTFTMPAAEVVNAYATFKLIHKHYMAVDTVDGLPNPTQEDPNHNDAEHVFFTTAISSNAELLALDADQGNSGIQLPAGNYVLTCEEEIYTDAKIVITEGTVNLCLNGKTLHLGTEYDDYIRVESGATLNICDCSRVDPKGALGSGKISRVNANPTNEGEMDGSHKISRHYGIWNRGSLNIYGGTYYVEGNKDISTLYIETTDAEKPAVLNLFSGLVTAKASADGTEACHILGIQAFNPGTAVNQYNDARVEARESANDSTITSAVYLYNYAIYKLHDGEIYGTSAGDNFIYGVYCTAPGSEFHMYDGLVKAEKENASQNINGRVRGISSYGKVYCSGGRVESDCLGVTVFAEDGGNGHYLEVSGNTHIQGSYCGIYNLGSTTVTGGTITGSDYGIYHSGRKFNLSGAPVLDGEKAHIYLASGKVITVDGAITGSDYEVLTAQKPIDAPDNRVQLTTGWATYGEGITDYPFTSKENYLVYKLSDDNELYLIIPKVVTDTDGNGTLAMTYPAEEDVRVGSTITLEAKPNEGYKYGTVTVTYTDANGNEVTVPVTDNGNGTYTFTMPAVEVVNAHATFKLIHKHAMSVECEETGSVVDFNQEWGSGFKGGLIGHGNYVLTDDIVLTENIRTNDDLYNKGYKYVNICLNGHELDMGSFQIDLGKYTYLSICDCEGGGKIISSNTTAAVYVKSQMSMIYLYGGTIESTVASGIYLPADGYVHRAYIYGGTISAKTDGIDSGSYTEINSDVATITADEGYAVRVGNGDFCLAGSSELNGKLADIYLGSGCVIDIDGKVNPEIPYSIDLAQSLSAVDQKIRITTDWTAEGDNSDPSVFYSVDGYEIYLETDGELYVKLHVHTHADGTTIIYNKALTQAVMDQYKGTDRLPEGDYVLVEDITSNTVHFMDDSNLCLFGHRINTTHREESFYSEETVYGKSASLRIEDCTGEGIIDTATVTSLHRAEITVAGGNIKVNGGNIDRGIYAFANGKFIMEGGNITVNNVEFGIGGNGYPSEIILLGGELTAKNYAVIANTTIKLSGSPKIHGNKADFALYVSMSDGTNHNYTITINGPLNPPKEEIYTIYSGLALSETLTKIQITTDWEKSGLASVNEGNNGVAVIPFKSTQGYDVVELDYTRADGTVTKELYLVKHQHCVYGANCEDIKAGNACTHGTIWFNQPLDQEMMESFPRSVEGTNSYVHIPSGYYFLASDIDMDFITEGLRFHEEATVYLCLNGHSITNLHEISSIGGAKVYICDCKNHPETGENQGRIDVSGEGEHGVVWAGLNKEDSGGSIFHHGGTINILNERSKNPLAVWDGGEFVLDGGTYVVNGNGATTEAIYGYWNYWYQNGPYPKLTLKSGTIKHTGTNYTVGQYGDTYLTLSGTVKIENDNAKADFYLNPDEEAEPGMTVLTITETFDPQDEIYSVELEGGLSAKRTKFRITDGWYKVELDTIPFVSTQGYMVVEMDYNGHRELYLVKPQADVYLWNGHDVTATGTQLFDAMYSYDPNYLTTIQDWTFTIPEVELETAGLPVGSDGNGITFDAVVGGYGGDAWVTIQQVDEESGAVLKTERLLVTLNIHVYDVKDSVYVLDYVLPVKLNETIFAQDTMPGVGEDVAVKFESYGKTEPVMQDNGLSMTIDVMEDLKGKYGLFTISEDGTEIIYTPDAMLEGKDEAYMIFRAHKIGVETSALGTSDPFKEVEMFKTINILPANVVYYEDDHTALNWNPDKNSDIKIETMGSSNCDYQDGDQNSEYGNDDAYQYAPDGTYYGSGGYSKKITVEASGPILTFTFTGTGFDLIGSTTADSGQFMYKITKGSTLIKSGALNTAYTGSGETDAAIHEVPLLHVQDLEHGTYDVLIQAVVNYDVSAPKDKWQNGKPPVVPAYLYFDGVRVYNPLAMDSKDRESYIPGEDTATFVQLRNMILTGQAAAAKIDANGLFSFGSGLVSYVEKAQNGLTYEGNKVTSLNDYLLAGPNNEVYFNENTQTLVFYVKETRAKNVTPMLQIAVRNLNPEAFDKAEGDSDAPEFALLGNQVDENGEVVKRGTVVDTLVSDDKAISYTEQYYTVNYKKCVVEYINGENYYRVVITARNSSAFSLTNLKVSGLEFYTIPASASSYKYDKDGNLIESTNPDATTMPSLQELAWQLQAANGMLPEDEIPGEDETPGEDAELKFRSVSLSLQSSIGMNIYVAKETLKGYTNPYVVLTKTVYDGNDASTVTVTLETYTEVTVQGVESLVFHYDDVAAKEMASNVQMQLFATKEGEADATAGEIRDYSVVQYAKNMLGRVTDSNLKILLVDMVNYGAKAQEYFDYNTQNPANAGFEAYQQYATKETPTMNSYAIFDDENEMAPAHEGATDYLTNVSGASLLLNEKVELNLFVPHKDALGNINEGKTIVVAYSDVSGNTVVKELPITAEELDSKQQYYRVTFDSLNATDMRTAFTAWVVDKDGMRISNSMTYSIESYCASMMAGTSAAHLKVQPLLIEMMKYGDSAVAYFSEPKVEEQ